MVDNKVYDTLKNYIKYHHMLYKHNTVSALLFEELLYKSMCENDIKCEWKYGSHKSDYDIVLDAGVGISCKSGKVDKKYRLTFSGYRTTSHKTLQDKINFIDSKQNVHTLFLTSSIDCDIIKYRLYHLKPNSFFYSDLVWDDKFIGLNSCGIKATIRQSMSDQLWTTIPIHMLDMCMSLDLSLCKNN